MARWHLFEFQDEAWYPTSLGDAGTAYLAHLSESMGLDAMLVPAIDEALERSGERQLVDLCAGAGGPSPAIVRQLRERGREVDLVLTDLEPNPELLARHESIARIYPGPVDAAQVPADLKGLRTIFNGFHHFDDALALRVLGDAVDAGAPIAIVELSERAPATILGSLLIPLAVWLTMLRIRPRRWDWIVLTYLIPLLPLTIAWDGLVSHLRTRSPEELESLVSRLDAPGWTWEARRVATGGPLAYTWLLGLPPR